MALPYKVWTRDVVRGAVSLDALLGLEDDFRLPDGEPLADTFPADVRLTMDPDKPKNLLFVDNLYNRHRILVVSERLAAFLQAREMPEVEFLPVGIVDHRGRLAKPVYRIAHPVRPVDCLDEAASKVRRMAVDRSRIAGLERLVLDPARVDPRRAMFRVAGYTAAVLVRTDIADAIEAAGFTGVGFLALDEYSDG